MVPGGRVTIECARLSEAYRLWFVGDIHIGATGCNEHKLDRTIAKIAADDNARWFGMGDYWDMIGWMDNRFDPEQIHQAHQAKFFTKYAESMLSYGAEKFSPIGSKCFGILQGNHEKGYEVRKDVSMARSLAERIGAKFLGYSAYIEIVFQTKERSVALRIRLHHGAGYAATPGGKFNRLLKTMNQAPDADLTVIGHVHEMVDTMRPKLDGGEDCSHIGAKNSVGIVAGTYLETYHEDANGGASYGEVKGYDPVPIGSPCFVYLPSEMTGGVEKPLGRIGRIL